MNLGAGLFEYKMLQSALRWGIWDDWVGTFRDINDIIDINDIRRGEIRSSKLEC